MPDDPRVQQLLDELLDSHVTPEEVCSSCLELLPVVRDRWRQLCHARAELDALFPPVVESGGSLPAILSEESHLPVVPGYEVESVLGLGGMGVVFRARHVRLNRVVALKMALAGQYAGPQERERFRREAEAVAILRHPNIVHVYDVGDAEGRPYFTMECIEGGSLAHKLAGIPLPALEAARLLGTVAAAVHTAHQAGIVHRDLKPANVLLTSDGIPKVSDFGLARRMGEQACLTRTGTAVGTPSYMAPEQARGKADAAGPPVDIYALGAILYELLTGRPPFRGETAAETVHQLITQDPVPPSRLNTKIPRDLETICLKCLHKEPSRRYATAAALADDLGRFQQGEAIVARPEGPLARLVRRVRRRPLAATVTLFTALLIGGGLWLLAERAATKRGVVAEQAAKERAAEDDLNEMEGALRKSDWTVARTALERARGRVGEHPSNESISRLERGALDLELAKRLDDIRLDGYTIVENSLDFHRSDKDYEEAFRKAGFGELADMEPAKAAERVVASPLRSVLVAALDHWSACCSDNPTRKVQLLEIIRLADPDSTGWRQRAADPDTWKDDASIIKLIDSTPAAYPSLPVILFIETGLSDSGINPVPILQRIQMTYPNDFWANVRLARSLSKSEPGEAVRFYQTALAIRPNAILIQNCLALALEASGRRVEAMEIYRRAVALTPKHTMAHSNLAVLLSRLSRHEEAIECVRTAIANDIRTPGLFSALGHSLQAKGRYAEAETAYREALLLEPKYLTALSALQGLYLQQGEFDKAQNAWKTVLEFNLADHRVFYGYAELCLFLGKEDEYRSTRRKLLKKFANEKDPYIAERTSRAALIFPSEGDDMKLAVALAGQAAAADKSKYGGAYSHFQFVRGLAEYRQGKHNLAIATMKGEASGVLGPAPRLVLAMALHRSGQMLEARKTLAAAVINHDWCANRVKDQDDWIYHSLRREAEQMILPNLPAFLDGKYQPRDNDNRLALLGVCQFTNRTLSLARLYADAFAEGPERPWDVTGQRFSAARAAAQAGCGSGVDATALNETERAKWRAQARQWLHASLAAWTKTLDGGNQAAREQVRIALTQWRAEPQLAVIRDTAEIEKLPADERTDCLALWGEVDVLLKRAR